MLLSEFMNGASAAEFTGAALPEDFVLAVDCSSSPSSPYAVTAFSPSDVSGYAVVRSGIYSLGADFEPQTVRKRYLLEGDVTIKYSAKRVFSVSGTRVFGDAFQDFIFALPDAFGSESGALTPQNAVMTMSYVRKYVYFNRLTGVGECGIVSFIFTPQKTASPLIPSAVTQVTMPFSLKMEFFPTPSLRKPLAFNYFTK